jgi:hypothetical protein
LKKVLFDEAAQVFLRYPVIKVRPPVGVTEFPGWSEPTQEAVNRAVELPLGVERPPWWRRWLRSEAEKMKGMRWRVRS